LAIPACCATLRAPWQTSPESWRSTVSPLFLMQAYRIGVALALEMERPLIYPRREVKEHGTRRAIEGPFRIGDVALVVDDLITRGDSKLEAIAPLEEAGLSVHDVVVLIDREQGGADDLSRRGYKLHARAALD